MDGIELYSIYQEKMGDQGVSVDDWDELDVTDREAWDRMAEGVVHAPVEG